MPCRARPPAGSAAAGRVGPEEPGQSTSTTLTLTSGGITLLGVLMSVGVTVAFGINADWWIRAIAGLGTAILLIFVVNFGTSAGRAPPARIARWTIRSSSADGS